MRNAWWLMVGGCGLFEGVENPFTVPPCEVASSVVVTSPEQDVGFLAPLGDRLAAITGEFAISVSEVQVEGGPYPGTLTVTPTGAITAIDSRPPADWPDQECPAMYLVEADAVLELDGGLLHLALPQLFAIQDGDPAIVGATPYLAGEHGPWRVVGEVDLTGTLDLRYAFHTDTAEYLVDPELITLGVSFLDGVAPSGAIEFDGTLSSPDEPTFDGTQIGWVALEF